MLGVVESRRASLQGQSAASLCNFYLVDFLFAQVVEKNAATVAIRLMPEFTGS